MFTLPTHYKISTSVREQCMQVFFHVNGNSRGASVPTDRENLQFRCMLHASSVRLSRITLIAS